MGSQDARTHEENGLGTGDHTGGEGLFTQWVHCEFVVSFEAICPVITQWVCGEFFKKYPPKYPVGTF